MKIISEEKPKEKIRYSSLEDGTLFKLGDGIFFVSSAAYDNIKLITRIDTGVTYTLHFDYIDEKDIIKTSTLIIER